MSGGKTVIELRVHGVSGTPPEAMLSCPKEFIEEVASYGRDAAFFRRQEWIDRAAKPPKAGQWWRRMEAYSWGGLTSGSATRAVWLLFLPFSLINLAHWMLPPVRRPGPARVVVVLLRLLALSFTMTLLLAMALAVLDIAVWQCTSLTYCSAGWGPLALLGTWSMGWRLFWGAIPLVLVIAVLWRLGREETVHESDSAQPFDKSKLPPGPLVKPGSRSPLACESFWNPDDAVGCMRACHVTVWAGVLGALVLAAPVLVPRAESVGAMNWLLLGANLTFVLGAVAATMSSLATGRGGTEAPASIRRILSSARWIALGVLGMTLAWVAATYDIAETESQTTSLPALHLSINLLAAVQAVLLVAVFAFLAWANVDRSTEPGWEPTLKGRTAGFVALLGWLLGGGLSAGVGLWTAQALGVWTYSADLAAGAVSARDVALASADPVKRVEAVSAAAPLIVPQAYVWASVGTVIVLVAAVCLVCCYWAKAFGKTALAEIDAVADQGDIENNAAAEVLKKITKSRRYATLTDRGPTVIASLVLIASALVVVAVPLLFVLAIPSIDTVVRDHFGNSAVGVTVFLVVLLVGLVGAALRNRQTRRLVAILWDVITFWPRANHPLTPPSYGGRTVFDLRVRMRELADAREPTRVVLVAHSQGTIIAAATLMQTTEPKERYPLLTFGSPLRRLYARNFPAYFGRGDLKSLTTFGVADDTHTPKRPRWINLWSLTDPIGSWIFNTTPTYIDGDVPPISMPVVLTGADCRVFDVAQVHPQVGDYNVSRSGPICGHSGFWLRGEYVTAVEVLQKLVAPDAEGCAAATVPPGDRVM